MHLTPETIGVLAGAIGLLGYVPYIISIFKNKTRPNQASWMIWTVVGALLAFSYMAEGDPNAIWLPLGYFFGPFIVALLSFRYGYSEWSRLDKLCVAMAALSIVPWLLTSNATATLLINLFIDSTGAIPTIVKSYREPETEDFSAWLIFFIANTIELFAISTWNQTSLYPLYLFFLAGSIVIFIIKDKIIKTYTGLINKALR